MYFRGCTHMLIDNVATLLNYSIVGLWNCVTYGQIQIINFDLVQGYIE